MPELPIDELYCTHCTYGTAALHRAQDARRDQVFEYSTRAGSVPQNQSHQVFQSVEQYVRFQLPGDTPAAEMVRLTAESTPWKRLAYFPAVAGRCVLVHACYRQRDTRDRPGSYFAHVLLGAATPTPAFGLLDALKMWGADFWQSADSPDLSFELPQHSSLRELSGYGARINDATLLAFLKTPANARWELTTTSGAREVIPQRWRAVEAEKRCQLLSDLLATVLTLNISRGDRLVVAVEPEVAALLFYGIARLVPFHSIVERLSVSTCQSHFENAVATLSAVSFYDPQTADLNPEAYRGAAINTFSQTPKRGQLIRSHAAADELVRLFVKHGDTSEIEQISRRAEKCGAAQLSDYEEILAAHAAIPQWSRPPSGDEPKMPGGKAGRRYLQLSLLDELRKWKPDSAEWRELEGAPQHARRLLGLLAGAEASPAILERLYDLIDDEELRTIVLDPQSPAELKVQLLQRTVVRTGEWPPTCDDFWNGRLPAGVPADLLQQVCGGVPHEQFAKVQDWLMDSLGEEPKHATDRYKNLLRVLLARCRQDDYERKQLKKAFEPPRFTDELGREVLRDGHLAGELVTAFPAEVAELGACAAGVLDQLPSQGRSFRERFQMIRGVQAVLTDSQRVRFAAWSGINDRLNQLASSYASSPAWYDRSGHKSRRLSIQTSGEALARDVDRALSGLSSMEKGETIHEIAKYVILEQLPEDFAQRLTSAIRHEGWEPRRAAAGERPGPGGAGRGWMFKVLVPLAAVVLVCVGFWLFGGVGWVRSLTSDRGDQLVASKDDPQKPKKRTDIPDEAPPPRKRGNNEREKKNGGEGNQRRQPVELEPVEKEEGMGEGNGSRSASTGTGTPEDEGKPGGKKPESKPAEDKTDEGKPKVKEVAVATPMPEKTAPAKLKYPEQRHDAHKDSVVVAERLPVTLGFGELDVLEQKFSGWPENVEGITVYGPTVLKDGAEPTYPMLTVSTSEKQLALSFARNEKDKPTEVLRISFDSTPSAQCVALKSKNQERDKKLDREIIQHLSTCILEFRYPTYSRYGYLGEIPKLEIRDDKPPSLDMPLFCRWFGNESDWISVSFTDGISKGGVQTWCSLPCGIPQQGGSGELQFHWESDGKGGSKIVLPRQYAKDRERERSQWRDLPIRLRNPTDKNWERYTEYCKELGISPLPSPPKERNFKDEEDRRNWENEAANWSKRRNDKIRECDQHIKDITEELNRLEIVLRALDAHCEIAAVSEPKWNKSDGRLESGIVRVVLFLKLQKRVQ